MKRVLLAFALILVLIPVSASTATAQSVNLASFLPTSGAVTGLSPTSTPYGAIADQETMWTTTGCSGRSLIEWRKGGGGWGAERLYLEGDYWRHISEMNFNGQDVTYYRVFRDNCSGRKGYGRFPAEIPADGSYTTHYFRQAPNQDPDYPSYSEERWGDYYIYRLQLCGVPNVYCYQIYDVHYSCNGQVNIAVNGTIFEITTRFIPAASSGAVVYDCRGQAPVSCSSTPISVDIIEHTEKWGSNQEEVYRFARWVDPEDSQQKGLGLYSWQTSVKNYVVSSPNLTIPCETCPDPGSLCQVE